MAKDIHKSILVHEGLDKLMKLYLCLLRNLSEQQTRHCRVRFDSASI